MNRNRFSLVLVILGTSAAISILALTKNTAAMPASDLYVASATPEPRFLALPLEEWRELMQPADNCPLPCWWGAVPGQTPASIVEVSSTFLNYLSTHTERDLSYWDGKYLFNFDYYTDDNPTPRAGPTVGVIPNEDRTVELISISVSELSDTGQSTAEYFSLMPILETQGTPDIIRVSVGYREDMGLLADSLFFVWSDNGLAVLYESKWHKSRDTTRLIRLSHAASTSGICGEFSVFLQDPQTSNQEEAIDDLISLIDIQRLPTPEEVFGLSNQEFAQILMDSDGCIPQYLPIIREQQ